MESYTKFLDRTNSFEKAQMEVGNGYFTVGDSLKCKVGLDNAFKEFYGDTAVFFLPQEVMERAYQIITTIYNEVPECFSEKLPFDTLHMTLHDLLSSEKFESIQHAMQENKEKIDSLTHEFTPSERFIRMRTNYVVNMVSTSLVLALQPCSEKDYLNLMRLYNIFDQVVELSYKFTPHITLAYYNVYGFDAFYANKLCAVVSRINNSGSGFEFYLDTKGLAYQTFSKMSQYKSFMLFCD